MSINVALVGLGYWGPNHARNLSTLPGARLFALCDLRPQQLAEFAARYPGALATSNYDELLSRPDLDAVVIATPAETHHALARKALEAGKDVLVEKPLALTYSDGADLVRLADERERILMVGHVLEYHPAIVALQRLMREGRLGKVRYIYSNRLSLGKIRREENILWSFAPHDIAIILRFVEEMPFQVVACGGSYIQPNIADVTVTDLLFDNGVRAHIFVSWLHPFKEHRLVVVGSQKMASFDDVAKKLVLYDQRVDWNNGEPLPVKGEGQEVPFETEEPLRLECQAFIRAVETRESPLTDGASGLRVLRVLQAAQRSLITNGEPITLPAEDLEGRPSLISASMRSVRQNGGAPLPKLPWPKRELEKLVKAAPQRMPRRKSAKTKSFARVLEQPVVSSKPSRRETDNF
jgi:predicted dehydrogenase